ncbi:hypothetical protein SAMN04487895_101699 [Paenibacillus sophorae]|uniref:Uncharacterized protein n=1 Tax=Paenibacillus sophorae TaxID=1333845 RepID=A0A1H8GZY9_9BACL|nr:hypothetical protein [Paenibacillus sophorae]QWU14390.1 hypothetical protein KP014_21010 [Paenibacillus sophorae]SEN49319.1 hypothetical protein SAMN04487895_101699 [Paenibacillus sophorae]
MPFSSKRGAHLEDPIFTIVVDEKWLVDILFLDRWNIKTTELGKRVGYKVRENMLVLEYKDVIPKSVVNKVVRLLKLDGAM